MTIEERLQFLLQSTESLHSTVQELTGNVQELTGNVQDLTGKLHDLTGVVAELGGSVADLTRVVGINSENIRLLANIAAAHQARLDDLDNRLSG